MIEAKPLAIALAAVVAVVETRCTIPILTHVRLEALGDRLRITGTDMDVWVSREIDAPGIGDWAVTAPAHDLLARVKAAPAKDSAVVLIPPGDDPRLTLAMGRNVSLMPVLDVDSFPMLTPGDTLATVRAPATDLVPLAKAGIPFMGKDEYRIALTGMHLSPGGDGEVCLTATDGGRMFQRTVRGSAIEGMLESAIIPRKAVEVLGKYGPDAGDIWIDLTANVARILCGPMEITTKLIDAIYPAFVAPERETVAQLDATALTKAIELVCVMVRDVKLRPFRMQLSAGELILSAGTDWSGTGETVLDGAFIDAGADAALDMEFNASTVLPALKAFRKGEAVALEYADDEKPIILRSLERADVEVIVAPRLKPKVETPLDRPVMIFEAPDHHGGGHFYRTQTFYLASEIKRYGGWTYHQFPSAAAANRAYRRHVAAAQVRCDVEAEPLEAVVWGRTQPAPHPRFSAPIPVSGYMPLPNWYLADVVRRQAARFNAETVFEKSADGDPTWTREVFDRKDVLDLKETPGLTAMTGRTKAIRAVGERWLRRAAANDLPAPAADAPVVVDDTPDYEPVPSGYVELTREQLTAMAERAARLEAAKSVFETTNDNDVPWTRKILGLKLRDAVEPTPMLTVLHGRNGPIRALGATALKRAA